TKLVCLPCLLVLLCAGDLLYAQATPAPRPARARAVQLRAVAPAQLAPPVAEAASNGLFDEPDMVVPPATAEAATPQDPKAAAQAQKKAAETQQKLQVIKKLQFDRKPSSILRVWHEYEKHKVDEAKKAEEEAKKQAEAADKEASEAKEATDADAAEATAESEAEAEAPKEEVTESKEEEAATEEDAASADDAA